MPARGGAQFDDLCNVRLEDASDKAYYSFNLTSLKGVTDKKAAVTKVAQQINATLEALTGPGRKKTVEKYTIGKTSGHRLKESTVDPTDPKTIGKTQISKRWNSHKREGKDGMVLVAAVTKTEAEALGFKDDPGYNNDPKKRKAGSTNAAERCALYLEKHLQKKFEGAGLNNSKDYRPGPLAPDADIYLVYIAYKYSRQRTVRPSQQQATPQLTQKPNANAYYTFNLADLSKASDNAKAVEILDKRIKDTREDLKVSTGKDILLSVGYADVDQREGCVLDTMDPSTFGKEKIQWTLDQHKRQGEDGMIVVAVISKCIATKLGFRDPPECAARITELISRKNSKQPQANDTACCLYMTFKFKERQ